MKAEASRAHEQRVAVLPVVLGGGHTPEMPDLARAAAWFAEVSDGRWAPRFETLEPVALPEDAAFFAVAGGMGPAPRNSQLLAAGALAALRSRGPERAPVTAGAEIVLVAAGAFRPHTWRLRNGGAYLGGGRTCRQYALLPSAAGLAVVAHELGHLLLDLPDLGTASGQSGACLMAPDAGATDPPPAPCAPLLIRLNWREPLAIERRTPVAALDAPSVLARFAAGPGALIVERPRADRLVVHLDRAAPNHPRRLAELPLSPADEPRPLLALLAPHARKLLALAN